MVSLDLLGTDVGRDDIELVVGCMDVHLGVGSVVTIGDRVGRFVDGIDVVGVLVVCMVFDFPLLRLIVLFEDLLELIGGLDL